MNDRLETLLSSPYRIRQFTIYALIIVLIAPVILPLISPIIGHHPLERLPNHGHIYPGGVPINHLHSHERTHHQDNSDPGAESSGIVYLQPTADTTGGKSFNVILIPLALSLITIFPPNTRLQKFYFGSVNQYIYPSRRDSSTSTGSLGAHSGNCRRRYAD